MKFSTVQNLFYGKHPEGQIYRIKGGKIAVRFDADSKPYKYSTRSNYGLAERLELIPHDDVETIAQRVMNAFFETDEIEVTDLTGAGDTIRWHWTNTYGITESTVVEKVISQDAYDRPVSLYTVVACEDDPWTCS